MRLLGEFVAGENSPCHFRLENRPLTPGYATGVELPLFDKHDSPQPHQIIPLMPTKNKTFHFWHVFVKNLKAGSYYAFRVSGPSVPEAGLRHNPNKVLIDPYARGNTKTLWIWNFWGYSTMGYFAPTPRTASGPRTACISRSSAMR